jgi:cation/acetate symporter
MVGLAFAIAAAANFPALLLALTWRRFNTAGAVTGVLFGGHQLDRGHPAGQGGAGGTSFLIPLANPGIISIPLGFLGCVLGTMLSRRPEREGSFDELFVRSETGLGADVSAGATAASSKGAAAATAAQTAIK